MPLSDGIAFLSLAIFANDPEKLLHVAGSLTISLTIDLGMHVKLPYLIDCPVKIRKSVPSERGTRYFGPSKMSFFNLLKHSLSIIAVFKTTLLIRSILFLIAYLFLVIGKISIITLIPVVGVIIMMLSVITLSKRENMSEYISSLENIESIDKIK